MGTAPTGWSANNRRRLCFPGIFGGTETSLPLTCSLISTWKPVPSPLSLSLSPLFVAVRGGSWRSFVAIRSLESRFREIGEGRGGGRWALGACLPTEGGGGRGEEEGRGAERWKESPVTCTASRCQICRARARWRVSSPVDQLERSRLPRFSRFDPLVTGFPFLGRKGGLIRLYENWSLNVSL